MTKAKPFIPLKAADPIAHSAEGNFLLPVCLPKPGLPSGKNLAVTVQDTIRSRRIDVAPSAQALADLHAVARYAAR